MILDPRLSYKKADETEIEEAEASDPDETYPVEAVVGTVYENAPGSAPSRKCACRGAEVPATVTFTNYRSRQSTGRKRAANLWASSTEGRCMHPSDRVCPDADINYKLDV